MINTVFKLRRYLYIGLILSLIMKCADFGSRQPLPTAATPSSLFGANDTSYIQLFPGWDASGIGYRFSEPRDIMIGRDGYIFVADYGNDKIVVLNKSGAIQNHSGLDQIQVEKPLAMSGDSKMNLFIVNGSNKIYHWNQYLNYAGIDSIAINYVLKDTVTNEQFIYSFSEAGKAMSDTMHHLIFVDFIFRGDAVSKDSVLNVSIFYEDQSENTQFMGVAAGPYGKNFLYATDAGRNRIVKIDLVPSGMVLLKNGWMGYTYTGKYSKTIVSFGSGAGTVDTPGSITTDADGNIYFTQTGGNFLVQKLSYKDYNSVFTLNEHPIMDLRDPPLFVHPSDIAVDNKSFIYVIEMEPYTHIKMNPDSTVDTTYCYVHKFTPDGRIVDLGNKGISQAIFQQPQGIAVDDENIIYITNTGMNRIERFKLSISEEDLPREP